MIKELRAQRSPSSIKQCLAQLRDVKLWEMETHGIQFVQVKKCKEMYDNNTTAKTLQNY